MKKQFFIFLISFILLVGISYAAQDDPSKIVPHQFWGSVTYNGASAPDGLEVVAYIGGVVVKTTTTLNGNYGLDPNIFKILDPDGNREGKTINFYVNGIDTGQSFIFENGGTTELDLSTSGPSVGSGTTGGGGGSSGGGGGGSSDGGGGGGGGVATLPTCAEKKGRICESAEACKGEILKTSDTKYCCNIACIPSEKTTTTLPQSNEDNTKVITEEQAKPSIFKRLLTVFTGAFVGTNTTSIGVAIIIGIIALGLVIYLVYARRKSKKK